MSPHPTSPIPRSCPRAGRARAASPMPSWPPAPGACASRARSGARPARRHIAAGTDAGTQWRVALSNVVAVLKAAGGEPGHLVALRAYVTDIAEFNAAGAAIGAAWGATLGKHFPAMTLVQVSALIDPNAKVEIEAEAVLP